jgi:hypothetical protein
VGQLLQILAVVLEVVEALLLLEVEALLLPFAVVLHASHERLQNGASLLR